MAFLTRGRSGLTAACLSALLLAAGCGDDDGTGPAAPSLTREISFEEFESVLEAGDVVRVEIELLRAVSPPTARELEIEKPEEIADEEKIESRIAQLDVSDSECAGTLTLAFGGIEVGFSAVTTEFEEDDHGDIACEEFVSRVQAELARGHEPPVEAERPPSFQEGAIIAQDPDDGSFAADKLELEGDDDEAELEINIDNDNLGDCTGISDPGCLGTLQVLDVVIIINRGTELEQEIEDEVDEVEFEGIVESVALDPENPELGTVTLTDGRVIKIVAGTEIKDGSGNDDHLGSLAEVKAAVDAGKIIEAEAEGVLESSDPPTLIAAEAEFEIEDEADDDQAGGVVEFEGGLVAADPDAGTFRLADGTVVNLPEGTPIDPEGDLLNLEDVATAVINDQPVRAEGDAAIESLGPPRLLSALNAKFQVDD